MSNSINSTVLRFLLVVLSLAAIGTPAAAGPLVPTSIGERITRYSDDLGQQVVTEDFREFRDGGFRVDFGYDGRVREGTVVDIAASFRVADLDPTLPSTLRLFVTQSWGYEALAVLELSVYASTGTVAMEDFSASALAGGNLPAVTIPMGDYRDEPRILDFDVTSLVDWARGAGVDNLGVRFHVDGGAHPAYVTVDRVLLGSGPLAVPEPSSSTLSLTAAASLGLLGLLSLRARSGRSQSRPTASPV